MSGPEPRPRTELFDGPEFAADPSGRPRSRVGQSWSSNAATPTSAAGTDSVRRVGRTEPDPAPRPVSRETLPPPARSRVLAVANQKGGVGKTTTAVNLAAALAQGGLTTLLIDVDPQGNASTALGVDHREGIRGTYEVLLDGDEISWHAVASPEATGLHVLPATIDLAAAELELVSVVGRERRLADALDRYLTTTPTDYVILDCPPSLGLLTLNALVAATELLLPIQTEYYALEGVSQLVRTIDRVTVDLNPDLVLTTVILTMYDARTRLSAQVADEVRRHFPGQTLAVTVPRSVRVAEAPSYGQTVMTYHAGSAGAEAYRDIAREVARRGSSPHRRTPTSP